MNDLLHPLSSNRGTGAGAGAGVEWYTSVSIIEQITQFTPSFQLIPMYVQYMYLFMFTYIIFENIFLTLQKAQCTVLVQYLLYILHIHVHIYIHKHSRAKLPLCYNWKKANEWKSEWICFVLVWTHDFSFFFFVFFDCYSLVSILGQNRLVNIVDIMFPRLNMTPLFSSLRTHKTNSEIW